MPRVTKTKDASGLPQPMLKAVTHSMQMMIYRLGMDKIRERLAVRRTAAMRPYAAVMHTRGDVCDGHPWTTACPMDTRASGLAAHII